MLCEEYEKRFGKTHSCADGIEHLYMMCERIPEGDLTPFAQCMPDEYKVEGDAVAAYRAYYKGEKARFAKWARGRTAPYWWTDDWIYGINYPII
jgi:putative sterol carrier protein